MPGGVEIVGAGDPRDARVEAVRRSLADHLLDDDRHLLVGDGPADGCRVGLGFGEEGGRVDEANGLDEAGEARVLLDLVVGDHLGAVDAGERVVESVLEQARGADRERGVDAGDQGPQVAHDLGRQLGLLEGVGDAVVGEIGEGQPGEIVAIHEAVEDVGREDDGLRHADLDVWKLLPVEPRQDVLVNLA